MSRLARLVVLLFLALVITGALAAYAATNTVPGTRLDIDDIAITANTLKPSYCSALDLTNIVSGSGNFNGTNGNDLMLGSAGDDRMNGLGGDDCLVGGGGDDDLRGQAGTDVCDGGTGTDTASGCETELNIP